MPSWHDKRGGMIRKKHALVTALALLAALVAAGDRGRGLDAGGAAAEAGRDEGDDGERIARGGRPAQASSRERGSSGGSHGGSTRAS